MSRSITNNVRCVVLLGVLLALLLPSFAAADVTFFHRAESVDLDDAGNNDHNGYTDNTATVNASPAIAAAAALVGSNGILINTGGEYYAFDSDSTNMNAAAGTVAFWLRIQTFANTATIFNLRPNSASATDMIRGVMNTTTNNHLTFRHRNSGVGTSDFECSVALSNDTSYFIIFKWDQSASDRRCEVYDEGGSSVGTAEDLSTSWTTPVTSYPRTDGLTFGEESGTAVAYYLDNIFIASTWADADTIYCNRGITTFSSYAACGGGGSTPRNLMLMGVGQ